MIRREYKLWSLFGLLPSKQPFRGWIDVRLCLGRWIVRCCRASNSSGGEHDGEEIWL
jgi:hypothetical protein